MIILIGSMLWYSGCVVTVKELVVEPVDVSYEGFIEEGLRVHTVEGHVLVFPEGGQLTSEHILGDGLLYGLNPADGGTIILSYPKSDIVAMEYVTTGVDKGRTAAVTTLGLVSLFGAIGIIWLMSVFG